MSDWKDRLHQTSGVFHAQHESDEARRQTELDRARPVVERFFGTAVLPAFEELQREYRSHGVEVIINPASRNIDGVTYRATVSIERNEVFPEFRFKVEGGPVPEHGYIHMRSEPFTYGTDGWEPMWRAGKTYSSVEHDYSHLARITKEEVIEDFLELYLPQINPELRLPDEKQRAKTLPSLARLTGMATEKLRLAGYPFPLFYDDMYLKYQGREVMGWWVQNLYPDAVSVYLVPGGDLVAVPVDAAKLGGDLPRATRFDPESTVPFNLELLCQRLRIQVIGSTEALPEDRWKEKHRPGRS